MRKTFVLFVLALAILAGFPAMTDAQSRTDGWVGRGGYGRGYPARQGRYGYDPYYDQLVRLPGNLVACQMDFDASKVVGCHPLVKTIEFMEEHAYAHQNRNELVGTTRVHDKKLLFCSYDDTNQRINTVTGGAMAGTGGAAIGGAFGGRRGAAVGAVGGAIIGGVIASRNAHDNCLEVGPSQSQDDAEAESIDSDKSANVTAETKEVRLANGLTILNETREMIRVYDGDKLIGTVTAGDTTPVGKPKRGYRAVVERFNNEGMVEELSLGRKAEGQVLIFNYISS